MLLSAGKRLFLRMAIGLVAAALPLASESAAQELDFNNARLEAGKAAYQIKAFPAAIDQFRVAAFGFLDDPPHLVQALARLSLAQSAAGRGTEADATLSRFLEVEQRFAVYSKAQLEPEIRAEFQTLLARRVAPATLKSIPSLAGSGGSGKVSNVAAGLLRRAQADGSHG
jgi:hypothetical protein